MPELQPPALLDDLAARSRSAAHPWLKPGGRLGLNPEKSSKTPKWGAVTLVIMVMVKRLMDGFSA
jgi:hypothetical protein